MNKKFLSPELKAVFIYLVFGLTWIVLTDQGLAHVFGETSSTTVFQTYKGWLFVFLSAGVMYALVRHHLRSLRVAEDKYRRLAENAHDLIYRYEFKPRRGFTYVSPSATALTGYTPEDHYADPDLGLKLIHPDDRPRLEQFSSSAVPESSIALRLVRRDGVNIWMEQRNVLIRDEAGQVVAVEGIARDVTERVHAEEALRATTIELDHYFAASLDLMGIVSQDSRFLRLNPAWEKTLGYPLAEMVGQSFFNFIHPDDILATEAAMSELAVNKEVLGFENRYRCRDGSYRWIEWHALPQGEKIYAAARDVTERKRMEMALRNSEMQYRRLFEHNPLPMWIFDANDLRFLAVNEAAVAKYGYTQAEFLTMTLADIHPASEVSTLINAVQTADIDEGMVYQSPDPWLHQTKAGRRLWVEIFGQSTTYFGRPARLVMVNDITERRRAEAVINARLRLHPFSYAPNIKKFMQKVLDEAEVLTESTIGFFHFVEEDGRTIHLQVWSTNTLAHMCDMDGSEMHYPLEAAGMWAEAVRDAQAHIYNDYPHHERARPLPVGHAAITRFISIPILHANQVVAIMGVGNKPTNYDQADLDTVSQLIGDISEMFLRQRAERLLREQEERLRLALQSANQGLYDLNLKTGEATINTEYARMLGYELDEMHETSQTWRERLHPQERDIVATMFNDYVAGKIPNYRVEFRQRTKRNEWRWILSVGKIVEYDSEGKPVRMLGTHTDITERKQAEERIRTQLRHLAALHSIDTAITNSLELPSVLAVVLEQALEQLNMDAAAILFFDPYTLSLRYAAGRGFLTNQIENTYLRLGEGVAGRVALEREVISLHHIPHRDVSPDMAQFMNVEGLVCYHAAPLIARGEVKGVLELFNRTPHATDDDWMNFFRALASQTAIALDNAHLFDGLQRANLELALAYDATIEGWSRALDLRDKETEGHSRRVTDLTERLARVLGVPNETLVHIRRGALLHDIGKMGVPDAILFKQGALTEDEWRIMRQHPVYAYELLAPVAHLRPALDIPYYHHEKWDGSGYPHGLKGETIPLAARIFAVVDVWDALTNDRPYRKAWSPAQAAAHIREQAGQHFDPQVVQAFLAHIIRQDAA